MIWIRRAAWLLAMMLCVQSAEAGSVAGLVVDENGAPLAGVTIEIVYQSFGADDLMGYGQSIKAQATSNRKGRYAIDIGHLPPGEYWAHAYRVIDNGGRPTNVDLVADDDSTFAGNADIVRNFTARLIESSAELPYGNGGVFVLNNAIMDFTDLSGALVHLVNQQSGQTVTAMVRSTGEGLAVTGIPLGTYRASVTLDGQPLQVQLWGPGEAEGFSSSVVHDFTMGWLGNQFQVAVKP